MKSLIRSRSILMVLALIFVALCLSSCETVDSFYKSSFNATDFPEECLLQSGEEPQVYWSDDFEADTYYLRSNYYLFLGYAAYNGPADSGFKNDVITLCKEKRAKTALFSWKYTDTRTSVNTYYTTQSVYNYGSWQYGSYRPGGFSTVRVPHTTSSSVDRYDYTVYLFIKMPKWLIEKNARYGISGRDLDSSDRMQLHRNTGVYVDVVYQDSPAYFANISRGDVIYSINGSEVKSITDFERIMDSIEGPITIGFSRSGIDHEITIQPLF